MLDYPTCPHPERALHPLTRYQSATGRWVPMRVCHACLGPAYLGGRGDDVSAYQIHREKPMRWEPNGR